MADWNDIKKAFEEDMNKKQAKFVADEEQLLEAIANYLCSQKGVSAIQGYQPEEVLEFLGKKVPEMKEALGGEWSKLDDFQFEGLAYTLTKKVRASGKMIEWKE